MLRRFWRWLQRWVRSWLQPQIKPISPQLHRRLTAVEAEQFLLDLLAQVQQGCGAGQVQAALTAVDRQAFGEWLWRWGKGLQPGEHGELAARLGMLARLEDGRVGAVARELSEWLAPQVSMPVSGLGESSAEVAELLAAGEEALNRGDYQGAVGLYQRVVEQDTGNVGGWYGVGLARYRLENDAEALVALNQALAIQPLHIPSLARRGLTYQALNRSDEALPDFQQAIAVEPKDAEDWRGRGIALDELKRHEEAIASYDKALEFKHDYHQAWNNRGNALKNLGQYEAAIASYDKALEFKPDFHEAWFNRGNALDDLGQYEAAIASFDKALEFKPDYHEAWSNRGNALDNLGQYEAAIASYDKALEFKNDFHEAWSNRGIALGNLGQYEAAIASYDKALEFKPDFHEAWFNRGVALKNLGQYEAAIASYDKALEFKHDFHYAWNNRGIALRNLGQYEAAIASYDKALEFKPDFHYAWNGRGLSVLALSSYSPFSDPPLSISKLKPLPSPNQINPQLQKRGYLGQVITLKTGIAQMGSMAEGWIYLQRKLGEAHFQQAQGLRKQRQPVAEILQEARDSFQFALTGLAAATPPDQPQQLEVLEWLIRVNLALPDLAQARQCQQQGRPIYEQLRAEQPAEARAKFGQKFAGFSQLEIDLLLGENDASQALELAEFYKNRRLTWLLDNQPEAITSPNLAHLQTLCNDQTTILYWHLSPDSLSTFIVTAHSQLPLVLAHNRVNQADQLNAWLKTWHHQYQTQIRKKPATPQSPDPIAPTDQPPWHDNLSSQLQQLGQILQTETICQQIPASTTNLILIPHRDLHLLPLHLYFPQFTCRYLPSAQLGLNRPRPTSPSPIKLLSIGFPDHNDLQKLIHAQMESEQICYFFRDSAPKQLHFDQATRAQVLVELPNPYTLLHFNGHGAYDADHPEHSALYLTAKDTLTLQDLKSLATKTPQPLSHIRLATLAACETAITANSLQDDYVGLVSGFLYAGVNQIISTLWPIKSSSSALLLIYFYQRLATNPQTNPAQALAEAQRWLKTATRQTLTEFIQELLAALPPQSPATNGLRDDLQREINVIANLDENPYQHPYHWAAFTITGLP